MKQGHEIIKLRNMFFYLKTFKEIFEKNNVDSANNYSKEKLNSLISFAFGITDPRSIKAKFDFGVMIGVIKINTFQGYRIEPSIVEVYEEFIEKNKDDLKELDLLGDYNE